jgi:hypothetical protein
VLRCSGLADAFGDPPNAVDNERPVVRIPGPLAHFLRNRFYIGARPGAPSTRLRLRTAAGTLDFRHGLIDALVRASMPDAYCFAEAFSARPFERALV